jgi:hypothetical protein
MFYGVTLKREAVTLDCAVWEAGAVHVQIRLLISGFSACIRMAAPFCSFLPLVATKARRQLELMRENVDDTDPSPEEIQQILQQAILRDYPNPERKGCIGASTLTAIAQQRLPHEHPDWKHVSRCSPCYREFLDNRQTFREARERTAKRRKILWGLTIFLAVILLTGFAAILIRNAH